MSTSIKVVTPTGDSGRTVELPDEIFNAKISIPLIHQVVNAQLAAGRQGTHKAKTRGEVAGGGRKPYRQKGTGRARQGSIRAPQFTGGGVVHGPVPRDYSQRTPKKMKAAALRAALSDRANNERIHVITNFVDADEQRLTRTGVQVVKTISDRRHVLVVADREDERSWLALRNVPEVHLVHPDQMNTYDVMLSDDVVFTERAFEDFVAFASKSEKEAAE
ncbi:MAG TPA: 50S ribosomal protein L4 [Streptosporangiaceae bacterium]|jgi:large subunit ribosomal protein L4